MATRMGQCCGKVPSSTDVPSNPDWMGQLPEALHHVPLNQLAIPGSHDSSSFYLDKNAPLGPDADPALKEACRIFKGAAKDIVYNWSRAQGMNYSEQLNAGVRYFDMRISTKDDTETLYLVHGMYSYPLENLLRAVKSFLDEHSKEVVLLDINHFYGLSDAHHEKCINTVMEILDGKMCPYLDMDSLNLATIWENKLQVLVFYQDPVAKNNFHLWPGQKIPSPWPNVPVTDKLMKILDNNYNAGRDMEKFYVTQGVLTPDTSLVVRNFLSTLEKCCSDKVAPAFVKWLSTRKAGKNGINVCIMDFVHLQDYIPTVLALNKTTWH